MLVSTLCVLWVFLVSALGQKRWTYISGYSPSITAYTVDDGILKPSSVSNGGVSVSWIAFHPTEQYVYAINEISPGWVLSYNINQSDGSLTLINRKETGGNGPAYVNIHPSGNWLFVANYADGFVSVFPIKGDGSIGDMTYNKYAGDQAHMAIHDLSGQFVLVPCKASDYIAQYSFDSNSSVLVPNAVPHVATPPKSGPRHIRFHPSGRYAFLIAELSSTVISYSYNVAKGTLTQLQIISTLPQDWKGDNTGSAIQISPDGRFVYASNRGHNSIVIYSFDTTSETLRVVGWETGNGKINTPRDFELVSGGEYLFVANQGGDTVIAFNRIASSGLLQELNTIKTTPMPTCVITSNRLG